MFANEIKQMMYIFGDVKTPSTESALLIEDIVLKQMRDLIKRACYVCEKQQRMNITITDILFLYRKDLVKLRRIVKHIELKELSRRVSVDEDSNDETTAGTVVSSRKKIPYSLDFLSDFDQEEIRSNDIDDVQRRRLESLDALTRNMNVEEYAEFSEARQSSNFYKNIARFKEWLDLPNSFPMVTVHSNVFTILGYLAYDAVQELVELAMLIKHHLEGDPIQSFHPPPQRPSITDTTSPASSTPLFFNISSPDTVPAANTGTVSTSSPPSSPVKSPSGGSSLSSPTLIVAKPKPRKRGRPPKNSTSSTVSDKAATVSTVTPLPSPVITALQPFHIMEAMRRQMRDINQPMIPFKV